MARLVSRLFVLVLPGCSLTTSLDELSAGRGEDGGTAGMGASTSSVAASSSSGSGAAAGAAGSGGAGGDAGGTTSAGGGGAADCDVASPGIFEILDVGAVGPPGINGYCTGPVWSKTQIVSFVGVADPDWNNATPNCTLAWSKASGHVFGCCTVTDSSLWAEITTQDGDVSSDDGTRFLLSTTASPTLDEGTVDVALNVRSPPVVRDVAYPNGLPDPAYTANVLAATALTGNLNDENPVDGDTKYILEWRFEVPQSVADAALPCDIIVHDRDHDGSMRRRRAFSACDDGQPSTWGTCIFSAKELMP